MKPRLIIGVLVALGLLLHPSTSYAKGPGHATISGPGLAAPIELGSASQFSVEAAKLADESGVWALQTDTANPRVRAVQPTGDLGPRYDATFDMPTGSLRQELYPFAAGGPATYTAPGQVAYEQHWKGGWYAAGATLQHSLVAFGVPVPVPTPVKTRTIDTGTTPSARDSGVLHSLVAAGCATAVVAIVIIRATRRERRRRRFL